MPANSVSALDREVAIHRRLARAGTVIDVGAHTGDFAFALADLSEINFVMVEPLPIAISKLHNRIRLHGSAKHFQLIESALSDWIGETIISLPSLPGSDPVWQWASIVKDFDELASRHSEIESVLKIKVPVTTLDSLALTNVTAIKIDAEGAEYEILRGGHRLIHRSRPIFSIELEERHRTGCTYSVPGYLDALGYDCFFELEGKILPFRLFDRVTMQRGGTSPADNDYSAPYINCFYFLPREAPGLYDRINVSVGDSLE